ncbi:MAG: hypothetical protein CL712_01635 [Chloroflexi bacterium]|nr:hypothetical protein [Chloroflexota bacterium]|tara:strand:- start:5593 stop:6123 length:531 start_codon:yes stop_codon:yes gene_type:complete
MKSMFFLLIFTTTLIIACGSSDNSESLEVITPSEQIFSLEDFTSVGYKKNRTYDVSELPGANGAWFGFWKNNGESNDFEIRIYSSHEDAVSMGEELAAEVSGNDGLIGKDEATWQEGSKDRRQVGGGVDKGSLGLQATGIFPKYGNYAIYGNVILLCEGQEEIALQTCWDLINAIK